MKKRSAMFRYLLCTFAAGILISACKKKDSSPVPDTDNGYVNNWIYTTMKQEYYWNTSITATPDYTKAPYDFFENLLHADDRYSWAVPNYKDLQNSLSGNTKEAGYNVGLFLHDGGTKLGGIIQYVKKNSPASAAGLKRGQLFFQINNTNFKYSSATNNADVNAFLDALGKDHTITVFDHIYSKDGLRDSTSNPTVKNLTVLEYAENPVYMDSVYTIDNKKIGYFVYHFFAPDRGQAGYENEYDNQVDVVFAKFKAAGVKHLILDLRYNGGGDARSTVNLGSNIVTGLSTTKVFFKREYNAFNTKKYTDAYGAEFFKTYFTNEANNIGTGLESFIILTSNNSASASELIINGLRPYMGVWLIGEKTYGKNVGSQTFYKINDAKNTWGLQPITSKAFNSLGTSDYTNGFAPDQEVLESLALGDWGNVKEPLLNKALTKILGHAPLRVASPESVSRTRVQYVGSSQMNKAYYHILVEPRPGE